MRQWLDCPAPTVTSERAPARSASPHRNSSLRALLPPAPRPVRSSRLTHSRAPPGSPGPRSSGVGSVASRERGTWSSAASTSIGELGASAVTASTVRGGGDRAAPRGDDGRPMTTDWNPVLRGEFAKPYWQELQAFVRAERERTVVYPPPDEVFAALHLTPYATTRVLILGQDPYHGPRQAHGLCFSVRRGRGDPAVARQHPQGAARRPRHRAARPRQPRGVGPPGRAAAEHDADGARRAGGVAPGQGLGDVHRRGHHARSTPRTTRSCSSCGAATPARRRRSSTRPGTRSSSRRTRRRCRRATASSAPSPFSRTNAALTAAGLDPIDWRL